MEATTVTCAVIFFGEKILAVQRSHSMNQPLKWEFPGGKLEQGETEKQCIKREILEELGIEIELTGTLQPNVHDYRDYVICLVPFLAKHVSGNIILKEHRNYLLLEKHELMNLDWAPADIPIVIQL